MGKRGQLARVNTAGVTSVVSAHAQSSSTAEGEHALEPKDVATDRTDAAPTRGSTDATPAVLSAAQAINPRLLTGDALKALAHKRGISRSELERMSDDKIREQIRYIDAHQYEG